jgi:hypothetical protein
LDDLHQAKNTIQKLKPLVAKQGDTSLNNAIDGALAGTEDAIKASQELNKGLAGRELGQAAEVRAVDSVHEIRASNALIKSAITNAQFSLNFVHDQNKDGFVQLLTNDALKNLALADGQKGQTYVYTPDRISVCTTNPN